MSMSAEGSQVSSLSSSASVDGEQSASRFEPRLISSEMRKRCRRVIFLDFDGVLHPPSAIEGARPPLTPSQIRKGWPNTFLHLHILEALLQSYTDVGVVVSSSWRMFLQDEQIAEILTPISRWYVGTTGCAYLGRAIAIRRWLQVNCIDDFVVLDDMKSYFPGTWPTLILCDPTAGISKPSVQEQLQAWLCRE